MNTWFIAWWRGLLRNMLYPINVVTFSCAWSVHGWMTVFGQANCLSMSPIAKVNSAFHPSRVCKSSAGLPGWG